jgi:hypothetical protein
MRALASLAHEEFHAISQEWSWIVQDRLLGTSAVSQFGEGLVELAVQEFLPSILSLIRLAPLRKSLHFLDGRKTYEPQREAARAMVDRVAAILGKPTAELIKSLLANGGGVIALRMLGHDIARHTARTDRYSDAQWFVWRFRNTLPAGAERTIVQELLGPFAELGDRAA